MDKHFVELLVKEKIVTKAQGNKIETRLAAEKKHRGGDAWIRVLMTLGALGLAAGAISFIAANWDELGKVAKVVMLLGSTFGALLAGVFFMFKKKMPILGAALIFLSPFFYGASVFLIAQIYNVQADAHWLLLVWLGGVVPLVYGFKEERIAKSMAFLASVIYFFWVGFYSVDFIGYTSLEGYAVPYIAFFSTVALFGLGGVHYWKKELAGVGRVYRLMALQLATLFLFVTTFGDVAGGLVSVREVGYPLPLLAFGAVALLLSVANLFFNPEKSKENNMIYGGTLGLLVFWGGLYALVPVLESGAANFLAIILNLIFVGLVLLAGYLGYQRTDMKLLNFCFAWGGLFILAKYFDWFWAMLDKSLFFVIGGLILILGGAAMEHKRRDIKVALKKK